MLWHWLKRNKLLVLIIVFLTLPVLLSGYMLWQVTHAEQFLEQHQRDKLNALVDKLDQTLKQGAGHLTGNGQDKEQVRYLDSVLKNFIAGNSKEFPELEVGLYSSSLHTMVVQGTGSYYLGRHFSTNNGQFTSEAEKQLMDIGGRRDGTVIEIYKPLVRNGQMEGVLWGIENLNLTGMQDKISHTKDNAYLVIVFSLLLGIGISVLLVRNFIAGVHNIKVGLKGLEYDLNQTLSAGSGEFGEIISAINHLAAQLVKVQGFNETILDSISDAVVAVDNEGTVIMANPAAGRILQLTENGRGRPVDEVFSPDLPFPGLLKQALNKGDLIREKHFSIGESVQSRQELLVSSVNLVNGRREIIGAMLNAVDITESIQLQQRVNLQERLAGLGKLVAGVAHEIRNPLTSISGYIEYLEKAENPSPRSWHNIKREVNRLNLILERLLFFARPVEARFVHGNINYLVETSLQFFLETGRNKVAVLRELAADLPKVRMDPEQMEQVLKNILFNAYQAMPEGGQLTVRTGRQDSLIYIEIADTGVGIEPKDLPYLFDPFFSTRAKGTGLGLAIAYEIVKAHGGHIQVCSDPGQGTTFRVYLQVAGGKNE